MMPNKITGANAGGPRRLPMRARWTARVAQFYRWAAKLARSISQKGSTMKTLSVAALLVIATLMAGCSQESTQQKAPAEPQPVAQTKPQPVPKTEAQSLPQTPPKPEPQPAPKRQAQPAPKQELARDGNWSGEGVNLTIQFVVTNRGTIVRDLSVSTRGLQLTGPNEGMVSLRGTTYPGEYPIVGSKFAVPGGAVAATFLSSTNAEGTAESTPWKGGIQP